MSKLNDIIKGHIAEALGNGQALHDVRMNICKQCPLLTHNTFGPICNPKLYLNKETNETSDSPQPGFERGCGCRLNAKTRLPDAECPLQKW